MSNPAITRRSATPTRSMDYVPSNTLRATPRKLRDGSWGASVTLPGADHPFAHCLDTWLPGQAVRITANSGKAWTTTVGRVLHMADGTALVTTERGKGSAPLSAAARREERAWSRHVTTSGDYDDHMGR